MDWNNNEGREIFKWVRIGLIVFAIFLAVQTLTAFKGLRNPEPAFNTISVTGTGEATAVPDIASFTFSVTSDGNTVTQVQGETTKKINAIIASLKDMGIEEKDIKTNNYNVYPKYRYESAVCGPTFCPPSRQVPDGYTAEHSILVKVRKTEDAGKALGIVGDTGATNISSISFTLDDPEQAVKEARSKAIENAKQKAELLSDELGVDLVRVVSYSDSHDGGMPRPMYGEAFGGDKAVNQASVAPSLPSGENTSTVNVTVTYEIR
ncbi:MAG: SIMPL domain-containing protein [Parcubacteria group bacterium]